MGVMNKYKRKERGKGEMKKERNLRRLSNGVSIGQEVESEGEMRIYKKNKEIRE